jgi:hypothetical protein
MLMMVVSVKNCTPDRFLLCQVWSELRRSRALELWKSGVLELRECGVPELQVQTCCKKGEGDNVASAYVLHPL